jgi:hypothetical protein
MAIFGQVITDNVACGVPKQMVSSQPWIPEVQPGREWFCRPGRDTNAKKSTVLCKTKLCSSKRSLAQSVCELHSLSHYGLATHSVLLSDCASMLFGAIGHSGGLMACSTWRDVSIKTRDNPPQRIAHSTFSDGQFRTGEN